MSCTEQCGTLLTHVAIQIVYCHHMLHLLWNVCDMLNFDTFILSKKISHRMNDQRTSCGIEDKQSSVQWICIQTAITFFVRKTQIHMPSASGAYGKLADRIRVNFKIFEILYRLNYMDLYFIDTSAMLLIVLEVHISWIFVYTVFQGMF